MDVNGHDIDVFNIIGHCPSLHTLEIEGCCSDDVVGFSLLQNVLTSGEHTLRRVNLSGNFISTRGSTFIGDFLAKNPPLEYLDLSGSRLVFPDALLIAEALKKNTNLRYIDLIHSGLPDEFRGLFRRVEFDSTTLNSAANSNHTCHIPFACRYNHIWYDTLVEDSPIKGFGSHPAPALRRKKIYKVLSRQHQNCSNVTHFEDVPIEVLPNMLISIQHCSEHQIAPFSHDEEDDDTPALSVIFEVMRRWDKVFPVYESISLGRNPPRRK